MATITRIQRRGIWNELPLPDGQIRHELVEWVYTTWMIVLYNDKDDIISITKNNEPTRTYRVQPSPGYAIKIRKDYIGSYFGAEDFFNIFVRVTEDTDYKFIYLEKIWDCVKPLKQCESKIVEQI